MKEEWGCGLVWQPSHVFLHAQGSPIVVVSTYTDHSGIFTTEVSEQLLPTTHAQSASEGKTSQSSIDEEDELLYGDVKQEKKDYR